MSFAAGVYQLRFIGNSNNFEALLTIGDDTGYTNDNGPDGRIDFVASFVNLFPDQIEVQAATFDVETVKQNKLTGVWTLGSFVSDAEFNLVDRDNGGRVDVRGRSSDELIRGFGLDENKFRGLGGDDTLVGGGGNDTLIGGGGADRVRAGGGDDTLKGGGGSDLLAGGGGADAMNGGGGGDTLKGGGGDDVLLGRRGDDLIIGGAGQDTLVFRNGDGEDEVRRFQKGNDVIDLSKVSDIEDFEDLVENHLNQDGASAIIDYGSGSILIKGAGDVMFEDGDFVF